MHGGHMEAVCPGCQARFKPRGAGHYYCDDCRTDGYTRTTVMAAKENLQAGGFTVAPLQNSSGALKDTSGRPIEDVTSELI